MVEPPGLEPCQRFIDEAKMQPNHYARTALRRSSQGAGNEAGSRVPSTRTKAKSKEPSGAQRSDSEGRGIGEVVGDLSDDMRRSLVLQGYSDHV